MDYFSLKEGYIITKNQNDNLKFDDTVVYLISAVEFFNKEI